MKKILTSFLVALSLVAITGLDSSLNTNTSTLQGKQTSTSIIAKAEAAEITQGVTAPDFTFTDLDKKEILLDLIDYQFKNK